MYIPHPIAYAYVMLFVMEMLRKISRISREDSLADSLVIPSIFAKAKGISSKTAVKNPTSKPLIWRFQHQEIWEGLPILYLLRLHKYDVSKMLGSIT